MKYTVVLDSPSAPTKRIQIAQLGDYHDDRYGDFSITADNVTNWQTNLAKLPGGEALIDFEHRSERKPRDSRAAGWITGIDLDGDKVMADARWTPEGEKAIKDGVYRFFSPAYGPHKDEHGNVYEDTLVSGALTNKPALTGMAAVTLASPERVQATIDEIEADNDRVLLDVLTSKARNGLDDSDFALPSQRAYPIHDISHARNALARASGKPEEATVKAAVYKKYPSLKPGGDSKQHSSDSRGADMDTAELIKTLGLDEDADEAKILEAVTALKDQPAEPVETKTLEQQAAENGMVVLDAEQVKTLTRQAAAGEAAQAALLEQRFEHAFDAAVEARKVKPAEKETLHKVYELDADLALKAMDEREPFMLAQPAGAPTIDLTQENVDPRDVAANGIHPNSFELDRQVRKYMLENKLPERDYAKVLDQWSKGALVL